MYWKLVLKGDELTFIDYKLPDNTIAVVAAPDQTMATVLFRIYAKYDIIKNFKGNIEPNMVEEANYDEFLAYIDDIK